MTYVTYLFGFPMGSLPPAHRHRLAAVSRPRHLRGAGAGRDRALSLAPHARPGRAHRCSSSAWTSCPDPAVRDLGHRPGADRLAGVAARRVLQLPRDPARDHGDRRAALSCRSGSSSTSSSGRRNSASSSIRRPAIEDAGAVCARCGERFASRMQIDDLRAGAAAAGLRLRHARTGRPLAGICARRASASRSPPPNCESRRNPVAKTPAIPGRTDQPLRAAPELRPAGRLAGRIAHAGPTSW